jgi:hypothetical protein
VEAMMNQNDLDMKRFGVLTVLDENGESHPLSEMWSEQPAVLIFIRHFG